MLASIDTWFVDNVYTPLRFSADPARGVADMFEAVDSYFRSGQRVCLVGAVALGAARDCSATGSKLILWAGSMRSAAALRRLGDDRTAAYHKAEQAVLEIQGALVLTRALDDKKVFSRALVVSRRRLIGR